MHKFDFIIVGSGPSAVSALESLKFANVLVLDAGSDLKSSDSDSLKNGINKLKKEGKIKLKDVIGENLESLNNIFSEYLSPKVKAPLLKFVTNNFQKKNNFETDNFFVLGSYAKGGLSNAWGGGSMRYTEEELKQFPIKYRDLEEFYNKLTLLMGINGEADDLSEQFISDEMLLPPPKLNHLSNELLRQYRKKNDLFKKNSMKIGLPRSAYLTVDYQNRSAYDYQALEFFKPNISAIYNSGFTLDEILKKHSNVVYWSNKKVISFNENESIVTVFFEDIETGEISSVTCKKLLIGAGCLNSAKIVLKSFEDLETKLPILDNLVSYIPMFCPKFIGKKEDENILPPQLILMYKELKIDYLCSLYKINVTLWGDYMFDFPLSIKGAISAIKYLVPSIMVMQVFYPDFPKKENFIQLKPDGNLYIKYELEEERGRIERKIISVFRRIGFFSFSFLIKKLKPGNSFHYSGCFPMKMNPGRFQTDRNCKLMPTKNVYLIDGSVFPNLPSKNNTFTIMANAMRVGKLVFESLN